MSTGELRARIAAILDGGVIVLNKGAAAGVETKDKFILTDGPIVIVDPDTGDPLEELTVPPLELEVQQVGQTISLCFLLATKNPFAQRSRLAVGKRAVRAALATLAKVEQMGDGPSALTEEELRAATGAV